MHYRVPKSTSSAYKIGYKIIPTLYVIFFGEYFINFHLVERHNNFLLILTQTSQFYMVRHTLPTVSIVQICIYLIL